MVRVPDCLSKGHMFDSRRWNYLTFPSKLVLPKISYLPSNKIRLRKASIRKCPSKNRAGPGKIEPMAIQVGPWGTAKIFFWKERQPCTLDLYHILLIGNSIIRYRSRIRKIEWSRNSRIISIKIAFKGQKFRNSILWET